MASFRKHGKLWYFRYIDASGKQIERKGHWDKKTAQAMARVAEDEAAKVRTGMIDSDELAYRSHEAKPLADHLNDWHRYILAKGKTLRHADQYRERAGKLVAMVKGKSLNDVEAGRSRSAIEQASKTLDKALSQAHFGDLSAESIQASLASLRDHGKSSQTVNHYRAAVRAFLRWAYDRNRIRDIPMRGVESLNVEEDQRHPRRALTDDELARLIQSAESGPIRFEMLGPLRGMAYHDDERTGVDKSSRGEMLASVSDDRVPISLMGSALKNEGIDDQSRLLTRIGAERGGFEPPRPVSQSNGLANRRYRPLSHLS
jgi:Phage integrase, N-terminal SAM-like domain